MPDDLHSSLSHTRLVPMQEKHEAWGEEHVEFGQLFLCNLRDQKNRWHGWLRTSTGLQCEETKDKWSQVMEPFVRKAQKTTGTSLFDPATATLVSSSPCFNFPGHEPDLDDPIRQSKCREIGLSQELVDHLLMGVRTAQEMQRPWRHKRTRGVRQNNPGFIQVIDRRVQRLKSPPPCQMLDRFSRLHSSSFHLWAVGCSLKWRVLEDDGENCTFSQWKYFTPTRKLRDVDTFSE